MRTRASSDDSRVRTNPGGTSLYHDMYALILSDWKRWYQARRSRQTRCWPIAVVFALIFLGVACKTSSTTGTPSKRRLAEDYPVSVLRCLGSKAHF